jgi:hypothetical protein
MNGVHFSKTKKYWIASYTNKKKGIKKMTFHTRSEKSAISKRLEWEKKYGVPKHGREPKAI